MKKAVITKFIFSSFFSLFLIATYSQSVPELIYYTFDEPGDQINFASAPVGNNPAQIIGMVPGGVGLFGKALTHNGNLPTGSGVNTDWPTNLPASGWTISFWFNDIPNGSSDANYLFGDSSANQFRCFVNGIALNGIMLRGGGLNDVLIPQVLPGPTSIHFVYDGSQIEAYENGILKISIPQPSLDIIGTDEFIIGGYGSYSFIPPSSLLDEFRIYNRALNSQEIADTWDAPFNPIVTTDPATNVTQTSATLNGTVDPTGSTALMSFEYGKTTNYDSSIVANPSQVSGTTVTSVSADINGLTPNTTYHFRTLGKISGTDYGSDVTFITLPEPSMTGPDNVCKDSEYNIYTTEAGQANYAWTVSSGGTITAGGGTTDNSVTVTWHTAGNQDVSVNYENGMGNAAPTPTVFPVLVNPLPVPTISSPALVYQSFENGGNIPAGWATETLAPNNAITFEDTTTYPPAYSPYHGDWLCRFNSYVNGGGIVRLKTTNPISTLNYNNVDIDFGWLESNSYPNANDRMEVQWSLDGTNWTSEQTIYRYNSVQGWVTKSVPLPLDALGQPTVYIGFKFISDFGNDCYLDLVQTIGGNTAVCEGNTIGYQTESGMNTYFWTVSEGGTIVSGAGTYQIDVQWDSIGADTVKVNYINTNGCKANDPTFELVTINAKPVPELNGPDTVCQGTTHDYTTQSGKLNYMWTISGGGTINGSSNTETVNVTWDELSSGNNRWLTVTFTDPGGCMVENPTELYVMVAPYPDATIAGTTFTCEDADPLEYTTEAGMFSYDWMISDGGSFTGSTDTSAVEVIWSDPGDQWVSVSYTNTYACNDTTPATLDVLVYETPETPVITQVMDTLFSSHPLGNQWHANDTAISGATDSLYFVTESGVYYTIVTLNDCVSDTSNVVFMLLTDIHEQTQNRLRIIPNPNAGQFRIGLEGMKEDDYTIRIYDAMGMEVWRRETRGERLETRNSKLETRVNLADYGNGIYLVVVESKNYREVRKLIINN